MADKITLERIKQSHPRIREMLYGQYIEVNNLLGANVRLRFAYVYRTPEEQHTLFLQRPKVTKADSWQSIHNYGLAFDIVLLIDKDNNGTFETASWDTIKDFDKDRQSDWMEVVNYFKSKGWKWGGDWKKFPDAPHFQYDFGFDWKTLKARVDKKTIITDENGIIYPKI